MPDCMEIQGRMLGGLTHDEKTDNAWNIHYARNDGNDGNGGVGNDSSYSEGIPQRKERLEIKYVLGLEDFGKKFPEDIVSMEHFIFRTKDPRINVQGPFDTGRPISP